MTESDSDGPPSAGIDAATFGRAVARAVKARPYSSSWALIGQAIEIATGQEIDDMEEIRELVERLSRDPEAWRE